MFIEEVPSVVPPAVDLSTSAARTSHYREVRARLMMKADVSPVPRSRVRVRRGTHVRDILCLSTPKEEAPPAERWSEILMEVCRKHNVSKEQIYRDLRDPLIVVARHEAMYRMSTEALMKTKAIGRRMGGRDRKSVVYGIARHAERMARA